MMRLSNSLLKILWVSVTISLFLVLISIAPIAQQISNPQPSAFILYPQPFEEIKDQTVFIVSMVSIPEEIADEYSLSGLFVYAGNEWLAVYPFQDEMIYDPMSRSYIGYFLSIWEPESEGVQNLLLEAVFVSSQPNTPFVLAADFRIVSICVPSILSCLSPTCCCGPRPPYVEGWDPICFFKQAPCDGNCFGYCFDEMGCRFKGGPCDGECWGYCFGEPTGPIPPDNGTSPPNDGGTPPSDDDGSDDSGTESPNGGCKGTSYYLPTPIILGRIVQPSEKEIVVSAGDTLILRADGLPNPDKDKKVSRSYNSETQSCSSSEIEIAGSNLSFIWRLWKESSGFNLVGVIGYGPQIQWQVPLEVGTYWIELIVDDDLYPDYDAPGEIVKCEKCSETSNADDPAARDWVKVIIQGNIRLLSSYPHHIVYRRQPEDIPLPEGEEVIGPEFGDPMIFDEGNDYEPDGEDLGANSGEAEVPIQEPEEKYVPPVTINPTPDPELDCPVINFSVRVIGYDLWQATIIIYPVGSSQPIATYTRLYPSNQTSVSVSWDDIFPKEKPPTGVYTYDILVEGISTQPPVTLLGSKASDKDDRLSKKSFIHNFQVIPYLNPETGLVTFSLKFQVLDVNGTEPKVKNAKVELRDFQGKRQGEFIMQRKEQNGQVWWEGNGSITIDAPDELGLWRLVACADVKEEDREKVVREVEKQLLIQVQISGVALGFRVWREGQPVGDDRERRYPYVGDEILFRTFLRVKWEIRIDRQGNDQVYWYSSHPVPRDQLSYYSWICHYAWGNGETMLLLPQSDVLNLPQSLLNLLEPRITWRRFYNCVVHNIDCGEGGHRWYGMRYSDVNNDGAFVYRWIAEVGTNWWGAKVEWWSQQNGVNGNAIRYRMAFLYPTNQRGGRHLIRLDRPLNFNRGYRNQLIWTPNPWNSGRISVRQRWVEQINFDENDPFFNNYQNREDAMRRQADLHRRILEWAYSFINVPYSWDGRSYGGYQSTNANEYSCSGRHNIGDSRGYGIDCSEFVSIVAELAGRPGGPRYTGGLARTNLARDINWEYVRPGDFAVVRGRHVVYARGRAVIRGGIVESLPTIEAGGDIPVVLNGVNIGTVGVTREWERTAAERTPIGSYLPRRWIVP